MVALIVASVPVLLAPGRSEAALPATYVALGDSFSSGDGISPAISGSGVCARSYAAYPELVTHEAHLAHLAFVACSGATISEVAAQVSRSRPTLARSSLVTLSAGGNDLSFSGLVRACIGLIGSTSATPIRYLPGVSGPAQCNAAITTAATLLGARVDSSTGLISADATATAIPLRTPSPIERRLTNLYRSTLRSMGSTTTSGDLVVVQYPTLLADVNGVACRLTSTPIELPVSSPINGLYPGFAAPFARQLIALNELLVKETSAVVLNLRLAESRHLSVVGASPFAPIDCSSGTSKDLYGIEVTPSTSGVVSASLHPTSAGQRRLAAAVLKQWLALRNAT